MEREAKNMKSFSLKPPPLFLAYPRYTPSERVPHQGLGLPKMEAKQILAGAIS